MHRTILLSVTLLVGCPDPSGPPAAGTSPGAADAGGQPSPPTDAELAFAVAPGEGVTISGTISYPGEKTGRIRMDFMRVDSEPPVLVHAMELQAMGDWSMEVPEDVGALRLVAFLDQTGDGPSPDDPAMLWPEPLNVATEDISGIDLVLDDAAGLTPSMVSGGGEPPHGQGAPDPAASGEPREE